MIKTANSLSARFLGAGIIGLAFSGSLAYAASCVVAPTVPPPPLDPALKKTVVITDPAVFSGADFSLGRTLGNIIKTTPGMVDSQAERVALLTTLVRSFRATSHVNTGVTFPVPVRAAEAALDPIAMLDPNNPNGMKPVGLFNRYDLAPADFKTCGEHRIVYAKNSSGPTDRFFLIFEAALDNPNQVLGLEGCRPIAQFWDSLKGKTGSVLATDLTKFYYDGLAPGIEAVVHFTNFGTPLGQVRGNIFKQGPWQLREWRIAVSADGSPVFTAVTVKSNPFPPLYGSTVGGENPGITGLRPQFQTEFITGRVPELVSVDQGGLAGNPEQAGDLFFQLGAAFARRFDGFESTSQDSHNPQLMATPNLKTKTTQRLNQLGVGAGCELTQEHILNRAGALSCGGCHHVNIGKPVAAGVNWPLSLGPAGFEFVHIDEMGKLSPALEQFFLPARAQNLARHLQPAPAAAAPAGAPSASPPDASAALNMRAIRQRVSAVPTAENRAAAIDAISDIEKQVQAARAAEQATPGAFVPFRRPH